MREGRFVPVGAAFWTGSQEVRGFESRRLHRRSPGLTQRPSKRPNRPYAGAEHQAHAFTRWRSRERVVGRGRLRH